ncbi:hypothetical protein D3C86_1762770 [compost metagenome]
MENLARLGIGGGIDRPGLVGGQVKEHAAGDGRVEPERLEGGDERVAPENRAEPRHAGIGIGPFRRIGDQHIEIGNAAP